LPKNETCLSLKSESFSLGRGFKTVFKKYMAENQPLRKNKATFPIRAFLYGADVLPACGCNMQEGFVLLYDVPVAGSNPAS
jgi:hypothetical protein